MTSEFYCPHCDRKYRGSEDLDGRNATCKSCGQKFEIAMFDDVELIEEEAPRVRSGVARTRDSRRRSKSSKTELTTALLIVGGGVLSLVILIAVVVFSVSNEVQEEQAAADNSPPMQAAENAVNELFLYDHIPLPLFPDLPPGQIIGSNGVLFSEFQLQGGNQPGQRMTLRVYMPAGSHQAKSLACVLVGPAGTPLITGSSIDGSDYHDESLPYAEAGAVAITFSLDGPFGANGAQENIKTAYTHFRDAAAGMVNCRNAMEYAIQKIAVVDPEKIVIAGHSSAACVALLFSEHEPRLAGCISYCPAADVEARIDEILDETKIQWMLPGVDQFKKKSAPMNHISATNCPVFLFHARDDSNCPYTDSTRYHEMLKNAGKQSELKLVPVGEHYQSMIDEGIPSGVDWMKRQGILSGQPQANAAPNEDDRSPQPNLNSPFMDL